jgi:hypothetical protein
MTSPYSPVPSVPLDVERRTAGTGARTAPSLPETEAVA